MTPKQKAIQLYNKYFELYPNQDGQFIAKQCALIAVDELLKDTNVSNPFEEIRLNFWLDVRLEIEKL